MMATVDTPAPKLPKAAREILGLAHDIRDIAAVGHVLKDFGRSVDDLPAKVATLSARIDKYFCQTAGAKVAVK